jgi:hypothetical protein
MAISSDNYIHLYMHHILYFSYFSDNYIHHIFTLLNLTCVLISSFSI